MKAQGRSASKPSVGHRFGSASDPVAPIPSGDRPRFYYGWVILAVAAVASFASAPGQTYTFSVFLGSFVDELGLSSTGVATLYMLGSLTAAVLIVVVGRAFDVLGARTVLTLAGVLIGLGALWMSRVSSALDLYVGFAVMRTLGQGALSLIPTTMVSIWFVRKRGRALALMALGGAIAGGAFPVLANVLVSAYGWRGAWVAIGFIAWGLLLVPALLLVRRSPEAVGLLPDGDQPRERADPDSRPEAESSAFTLGEAVRTRALWMLMIAGSAQSMVGTGLMFHQVSLFSQRGLSASTAAAVFGVIAPTMIAGQFVSGFLVDRYRVHYLIAIAQLFVTLTALLAVVLSEPWHAYVYGAVLGTTMGFLMNSLTCIWPDYYGRRHLGTIRGVTQTAMMASAAGGALPLAVAFDVTGSYTAGLMVFAVLPLLSGAAAVLATRPARPAAGGGSLGSRLRGNDREGVE